MTDLDHSRAHIINAVLTTARNGNLSKFARIWPKNKHTAGPLAPDKKDWGLKVYTSLDPTYANSIPPLAQLLELKLLDCG